MQVDEIVARALCRSKQKWGDTAAVTEQYVDVCWRDYLPDAKVAITAYLSARSAEPVAGLTAAEQKAQGARCSCRGVDDYCPCQNVPDEKTRRARALSELAAVDAELL